MPVCRFVRTVSSAVLALLLCAASVCAQTGPERLPPGLMPPGTTVYLRAELAGTMDFVCARTDAMAWAWIPRASRAALLGDRREPIGTYASQIMVIPPPPERAAWLDTEGGAVEAVHASSGRIEGEHRVAERFDVQSRRGTGPFSQAKNIIRILPDRAVRPSQICDESQSNEELVLPYSGEVMFIK